MNKPKQGWVKSAQTYERGSNEDHERPAVARDRARGAGRSLQDDGPAPDIRDLFSFELQRLAGLSTRIATLSIRPKYGLTTREWRALAVLKYLGTVPLQELSKHSGLLKSQMSRTVSGLIDRGYIQKAANPEDGRSILLRLSPDGLDLSEQVLDDSFERNEQMLASLSNAERQMLVELMRRVIRTSSTYFHDLKQRATPSDLDQLDEE
ncbi:MarR family transcriptional regulator [Mesorhizobium sp. AD1-1]|uniref:MarR family winged helix-turn-helix transcriptional regulator n=1 Tax=Mesorhizobium sp. AD1-1 TaxID=2876621 RepID=UPI001CCF6574|nr:MarR family transcriptional regulator [Mesorhizobium sp. AD1-1]MBZ9719674.1 MarR family transcriptional regulator [Mesorhizobium sp. AD1-1]